MNDKVPTYRRHPNGQAFIYHASIPTADHRLYLGKHGSDESKQRYAEAVTRILTGDFATSTASPQSILELIAQYLTWAERYYATNGKPGREFYSMKYSLDPLASIYGSTMANDFGPRKLSAIQVHLVSRDLCRTTINGRIGRIKRFFRWCCKNELVDAELYAKLQAVEGLKIGQFDVREAERVQPVTWDTVKQLIPFLSPTLEAMVTAQFWCGLRPGEVTIMRRCDIDRSESVAPWHRNSAL